MAADGSIQPAMDSSWSRLQVWPAISSPAGRSLRVVDLFSGCGGMTLGVWEAARQLGFGMDVRLAVDFNPSASAVYRDNFQSDGTQIICDDVGAVISGAVGSAVDDKLAEFIARVGEVDILLAGPPCQGHSDLNNHSRRYDPRNDLYMSAVRGVEIFRPAFVLIENVPAVVHDRSGVVDRAAACLERLGYNVAQLVVEMSNFGVAQRRKRHVTLASRVLSWRELCELAEPAISRVSTVKDAIDDLQDEADLKSGAFYASSRVSAQNAERIWWLFKNDAYDLPDEFRPACHREKEHSYRSMYGRMRWDLPAQTLTTGFGSMGQGRYVHPARPRTLTCHEAARIQGFPDFFNFGSCASLSAMREMIGNAVPAPFVTAVVKRAFGRS